MLLLAVTLPLIFAAPALAQPVEFAKIREGSPVDLVLGTGGECRGKVARRVDGALTVALTSSSPDCGARGDLVTVRQESVQDVERIKVSGPSTRRKIIAVAAAFGIGMLIPRVAPVAMLGVGAGGAEAVHIMNRDMDRSDGTR